MAQVYPVPLEPRDTLRKWVVDSAREKGWAGTKEEDDVPSGWCDSVNVHVYLYVDLGPGEPNCSNYPDQV